MKKLLFGLLFISTFSMTDKVDDALSEVRGVKDDLFSSESSVLGALATPAEMAAHQMRCRLRPMPVRGVDRNLKFDAATKKRAAELNIETLRKNKQAHAIGDDRAAAKLGEMQGQSAEYLRRFKAN